MTKNYRLIERLHLKKSCSGCFTNKDIFEQVITLEQILQRYKLRKRHIKTNLLLHNYENTIIYKNSKAIVEVCFEMFAITKICTYERIKK